jgi:outer membrane protein OmpA-like peptidoglycan-associated protein
MDAAASGHRAVTLRSNRHSWVLQPEIPEDGNYQIIVRARGTLFGSAYASLGVILGENITDAGSVRLSNSSWQRVPVGRPIALKKGKQWVGIALANEFRYRNQSLRHADIDQFEIRRVATGSNNGGGMMMGGMMMQAGDAKSNAGNLRTANRLQCAFSSIHEGEEINGRVDIRASLQSPSLKSDNDYQEIRSDLWINDAYFATASAMLSADGRAKLESFFTTSDAFSYTVAGHTDSRGSDAYNQSLSEARARAVADVARSVGAVVESETGYGESQPVASNETSEGMALNRRVEVFCKKG